MLNLLHHVAFQSGMVVNSSARMNPAVCSFYAGIYIWPTLLVSPHTAAAEQVIRSINSHHWLKSHRAWYWAGDYVHKLPSLADVTQGLWPIGLMVRVLI